MPANTSKLSVSSVLQSLATAGSTIVLGVQVGEEVVPLVKGLIADVKSLIDGKTQSITYSVALQLSDAALDDAASLDQADLALINAELVRQNLPPLTVPPDEAVTQPPPNDAPPIDQTGS